MTEDGFEKTRLLETPGSRVVTVSSVGHKRGGMNFEDLNFTKGYRFSDAYFQSKLANLLFTYELQHRLAAAGASTIAVAGGEYLGPEGRNEWTGYPTRVPNRQRT